ncbi:MAG: TraX family protein [Acutalibacteraceae bacterium]
MRSLKCLSANQIKAVAVTAMLADHLAWWLLTTGSAGGQLVHFIGRLTAPLMCWFIAHGYTHTSDVRRYIQRLIIFAVISHFPYVIYFGFRWYANTSVIFTLLLGLIAIHFCSKYRNKTLQLLFILFCCILAYNSDWSYIAVLWIVFFYRFRSNLKAQLIAFISIGLAFYALPQFILSEFSDVYVFGFLLAVPFILLYSGRRGKKSALTKWSFYIFYPLHLIILSVLKYIVFE